MKLVTTLGPLLALLKLTDAQAMAPGAAPNAPAGAPAAAPPAAGAPAAAPPAAGAPAAGAPAAGAPAAAPAAPAASSTAATQPSAPAVIPGTALGAGAAQLVGTWSSKSNAVFTGPDFYDPVDELLIEPALPGMSYSFTEDGFFEEAIYQVEANPRDPTCPTAVLIFQHGKYEVLSNNSIVLHPIEVDGRQLLSDPCNSTVSSQSVYSRYNQTEFFKSWQVYVDEFWGRYRLDLFQFDGSPLPPFYLSYKPPMMLPTITMNPTAAPGETGNSQKSKRTVGTVERIRRSLENRSKTKAVKVSDFDFNALWWTGVGLMTVGAAGWYIA